MKKHMTQEVAIKSAWMILEGLGYDRARNGDLEKTVTAMYESAPAADVVEVRHAYKIDIATVEDYVPWCKCSACGYDGLFLEDEYCSRCGAKLDVPVTNVGTWAVTENEIDTSR